MKWPILAKIGSGVHRHLNVAGGLDFHMQFLFFIEIQHHFMNGFGEEFARPVRRGHFVINLIDEQ